MNLLLLAQVTADDLYRETARLQGTYEMFSYVLTVLWIILVVGVLVMMMREKDLRRQLADLRALLDAKSLEGHRR